MIETDNETYLNLAEKQLKKVVCKGYENEIKKINILIENFKQKCFNYAVEEHIKELWYKRRKENENNNTT